MTGTWTYTESTNTVVVTGGTSGTPATFADFVAADRTVATTACSVGSGAQLKAAAAVAAATDITLTYPVRPVEFKGLRLAITTAQAGGAAVSGDEAVDVYGTTPIWCYMTGASASGQKVVPVANLTHLFQVGDTVILIDISAPATYETDVIASISEGVSITLTNNNANSYAAADVVGVYQTENISLAAAFGTYWTTLPYGQIAKFAFAGFDGTNTAKIDQPIWGVIWNISTDTFLINSLFSIGDGSTSTYFISKNQIVKWSIDVYPIVKASATLQIGELDATLSLVQNGSYFAIPSITYTIYPTINLGTLLVYGSTLYFYAYASFPAFLINDKSCTFVDSLIECGMTQGIMTLIGLSSSSSTFTNSIFNIVGSSVSWITTQANFTSTDCKFINKGTSSTASVISIGAPGLTLTGPKLYIGSSGNHLNISTGGLGSDINVVNPIYTGSNLKIRWGSDSTTTVNEKYTIDMNVCDKSGNSLENATVTLVDSGSVQVFSVNTNASGNITQQVATRRVYPKGVAISDKSPHIFTISKIGYETLVLDNITVDGPIDWHLELQPNLKMDLNGQFFLSSMAGNLLLPLSGG